VDAIELFCLLFSMYQPRHPAIPQGFNLFQISSPRNLIPSSSLLSTWSIAHLVEEINQIPGALRFLMHIASSPYSRVSRFNTVVARAISAITLLRRLPLSLALSNHRQMKLSVLIMRGFGCHKQFPILRVDFSYLGFFRRSAGCALELSLLGVYH
jgi:hypothetical protein